VSDTHEPHELLGEEALNLHRALSSLKEEIEAVDWYHQRVVLCRDTSLARVLAHNRDEEIEHACMTLEWLRRNVPTWHANLKKYLFSEGSDIVALDEDEHETEQAKPNEPATPSGPGSLGIGSLKGGPR